MRLVDSSAWIEWIIGSPTGAKLASALPDVDDWLVPTMVQLELAKWLVRNLPSEADKIIGVSRNYVVAPMTTHIALMAAQASINHKLATADAVIYATAQEHGAELLTCDVHFRDLPGVILVEKN
jgi:predicted nucleic acid-binding protein